MRAYQSSRAKTVHQQQSLGDFKIWPEIANLKGKGPGGGLSNTCLGNSLSQEMRWGALLRLLFLRGLLSLYVKGSLMDCCWCTVLATLVRSHGRTISNNSRCWSRQTLALDYSIGLKHGSAGPPREMRRRATQYLWRLKAVLFPPLSAEIRATVPARDEVFSSYHCHGYQRMKLSPFILTLAYITLLSFFLGLT